MSSQHWLKNVAFTSDATNTISNSVLATYGNKSVELSVIKDVINMYQNSLLEKEKILEEEKQKLSELNDQVWSLKDFYCDRIWQFAREYDFSIIFKHYPFIMEIDRCKRQKKNFKDDIESKSDIESSSKLIDLINEIDVIKAEISNLNCGKKFKQDVESALTKLKKLQLISDDATELVRLISLELLYNTTTLISMPIYDEMIPNHTNKITRRKNNSVCKNLNDKKVRNNQKESLLLNKSHLKHMKLNAVANDKEVIVTPKDYPQLFFEKSIVFSVKTGIMDVSIEPTDEKYKNFTPKKRSEVSVRFEQHREHKNNYQ